MTLFLSLSGSVRRLKEAANVGYFAQLSREPFNCQTGWRRGRDLNPRDPFSPQ